MYTEWNSYSSQEMTFCHNLLICKMLFYIKNRTEVFMLQMYNKSNPCDSCTIFIWFKSYNSIHMHQNLAHLWHKNKSCSLEDKNMYMNFTKTGNLNVEIWKALQRSCNTAYTCFCVAQKKRREIKSWQFLLLRSMPKKLIPSD